MKRLFPIALALVTILALSGCTNMKGAMKSSSSLTNFLGFTENPDWYIRKRYFYPDSKWIPNDFGLQMHYRDVGEGPVVLLLHSEMSSMHSYEKWMEVLSAEFRVIAIDLPGAGLTSAPHCVNDPEETCADNLSLEYIRHTLNYFIEDMKLQDFSIVANSLSGYLAAEYVLDNSHRIEKVVLISPLGMSQETPWIVRYMTAPGMDLLHSHFQPASTITSILEEFYGSRTNLREAVLERYLHLGQSEGAFTSNVRTLKIVREIMESGLDLKISDIDKPTLIMWGGKDSWGDRDHAKKWSDAIKDSVLLKYPKLGHVPMEEAPEQSAHDVLAFLKGDPIPTLTGLGSGGAFTVKQAEAEFDKATLFGTQEGGMESAEKKDGADADEATMEEAEMEITAPDEPADTPKGDGHAH